MVITTRSNVKMSKAIKAKVASLSCLTLQTLQQAIVGTEEKIVRVMTRDRPQIINWKGGEETGSIHCRFGQS